MSTGRGHQVPSDTGGGDQPFIMYFYTKCYVQLVTLTVEWRLNKHKYFVDTYQAPGYLA